MTDIDTSNLVVWPKWCYLNAPMENEAQDLVISVNNNNNSPSNRNKNSPTGNGAIEEKESSLLSVQRIRKHKRKELTSGVGVTTLGPTTHHFSNGMPADTSAGVKAERLSPEGGAEGRRVSPTPSSSPKSPASHRTRTPSFAGTPPNPAFTPPTTGLHTPYDGFSTLGAMGSLSAGHGTVKQMENMITRNCSDLMRSLAAKYNNSNPNDYFSSPNNGILRSPLSTLSTYKSSPSPFMGVATSPNVSNNHREIDKKLCDPPASTVPSVIPPGIATPGAPLFHGPTIPGFPSFPLVDMSSTQVLLNMVRNASTTQHNQLETYLRGAMKRPADVHTSPLDLSASVGAKKPRLDSTLVAARAFDVKNLFPGVNDDEKKIHQEKPSSPISLMSNNSSFKPNLSPPNPASLTKQHPGTLCSERDCPSLEAVLHWTVDDVCGFIRSIDLCAEYTEAFREHRIDGSALPLLTEEHLTSSIGMKLGPALKLRSTLARRLGACNICLHCSHCHSAASDRRPNSTSSGQ